MSILSSLYSAAAGLNAHGSALGVVSDNIANVSTFGFKSGRAQFEDVLGSTVASATLASVGRGSRMAGVQRIYTQGSLLATGKSTDLAIQGDGFFTLAGNHQGVEGTFFSRAGMFHLNNEGRLESPQGLLVQGYVADAQGNLGTKLQGFFIPPNAAVPARATEEIDLAANVNSVDDEQVNAFDPLDADNTSNFSTSVTVYDSLGMGHTVDVYFRKHQNFDEAAGEDMAWSWHAVVDGKEVTDAGSVDDEAFEIANGVLTFAPSGELLQEYNIEEAIAAGGPLDGQAATSISGNGSIGTTDSNGASADGTWFLNFEGAVSDQAIKFDFGDAQAAIAQGGEEGSGLTGVTSFASPSSVFAVNQDGFAAGSLIGVTIAEDGKVTGTFTNGERRVLGQLAMARFRNNEGLVRAGGTLYVASEDSGEALIGLAGTAGRGSLAPGSLEQSNVDLAQEFVNLIAYQRGFQANSRTVKAGDEMMMELVNLKR